jgi:hypothetical protein
MTHDDKYINRLNVHKKQDVFVNTINSQHGLILNNVFVSCDLFQEELQGSATSTPALPHHASSCPSILSRVHFSIYNTPP